MLLAFSEVPAHIAGLKSSDQRSRIAFSPTSPDFREESVMILFHPRRQVLR
jgi:hypothetical protein